MCKNLELHFLSCRFINIRRQVYVTPPPLNFRFDLREYA